MEADTLTEPSVLQVFSIDVRFIYWWIFILACWYAQTLRKPPALVGDKDVNGAHASFSTFGLVISPAKRYWRTIKESSLDTKVKDSNKQVVSTLEIVSTANTYIQRCLATL